MFKNYSQTYASQILALAGMITLIGNKFGFPLLETDIVLVLGGLANVIGIGWALYDRHSKGDVTIGGFKK